MTTINYFSSINEFLDRGDRLLVLHEANLKSKDTEEFFLMINKKSIDPSILPILENISLSSHPHVANLSKASQLYIGDRTEKFLFIHISSMDYQGDNIKETILKDADYISNNFRDTLIQAHPILGQFAEAELQPTYNHSKQPSIEDTFADISQQALKDIKKDTQEMVALAKGFLDSKGSEATQKLQQRFEEAKPHIDEKIAQSKTKLIQISTSLKDGILKQHKILSKLTKGNK